MAPADNTGFQKAIELTENALAELNHLATAQMRSGAEISSHVEAAERALRDSLHQLVAAERESSRRVATDARPAHISTARLAKGRSEPT
jgi:hypothetical protein